MEGKSHNAFVSRICSCQAFDMARQKAILVMTRLCDSLTRSGICSYQVRLILMSDRYIAVSDLKHGDVYTGLL